MNPSQAFPEHPSLRWNATHYYIITFIITLLHYTLLARNLVEGNGFSNSHGQSRCQRKKRQIRKNEL